MNVNKLQFSFLLAQVICNLLAPITSINSLNTWVLGKDYNPIYQLV